MMVMAKDSEAVSPSSSVAVRTWTVRSRASAGAPESVREPGEKVSPGGSAGVTA